MKFLKDYSSFFESSVILPADEKTKKFVEKLSIGEVFDADVQTVRNYQQLKLYWTTCKAVAENKRREQFNDLDESRKVCEYIKLKLGYVDYRIVIKDKVHIKTKSISYAKMSQEEWKEFFDKALNVIENNLIDYTVSAIPLQNYEEEVIDDR